jgi:hypothetical protein
LRLSQEKQFIDATSLFPVTFKAIATIKNKILGKPNVPACQIASAVRDCNVYFDGLRTSPIFNAATAANNKSVQSLPVYRYRR